MTKDNVLRWLGGKNVVIVGQVVGQGSLILATPAITRIYAPEVFGLFQLCLFLATFIIPVATLRYEQVIPALARDRSALTARRLTVLATAICVVAVVIVGMIVSKFSAENALEIAFTSSLLIVATSWSIIDTAMLIRGRRFRLLAHRNALNGLGFLVAQLVLGVVIGPTPVVMGLAFFVGRVIAVLLTTRRVTPTVECKESGGGDEARLAKRNIIPGILAGQLAAINTQGLPSLFTLAGFPGIAGSLTTAQRIGAAPYSFIGTPAGQLIASTVAASIKDGVQYKIFSHLRRESMKLLLVGLMYAIPVGVLFLTYDYVILGEQWRGTGRILCVLLPMYVLQICVGPITVVLPLFNKQKVLLIYEGIRAGALVTTYVIVTSLEAPTMVVLAMWSGFMVVSYVAIYVYIVRTVKHN